ncbi:ABC transporter sugar-binding protein [Candidatus Vecturithrix granuli]|uniref:ABC transporter sugar-binding protein n=1 Tax=Vecturithrix granuli TaxID=1499967 RepID=A0A081C8A3_VECG1|nr:ABC transporter sugar-binding protein [Candidatus Vecturithrix granuli]
MKKQIGIMVVSLLIVMAFTVTADAEDKLVIAMVPKALDNPIFVDARESSKAAGEELGVEVIWTASQKSDAAEQAALVESLIQKKVNAIGISVNDPTALKDVIDKAVEAGILVATWDADSPDSKRLFYLGTDNYGGGYKCGQLMIDLLGGKGKVAVLTGVIGAFNLEERIRGFKDAVKDTEVEVVDILACDDDINKSVEVVNTYTMANTGKFDAWFFDGGWPLFVPIDTLDPVRKFPGKVISFDTFPPMLLYVKEDVVDVLAGQNYERMGRGTVELLVQILRGELKKEDVEPIMDSGLEIVDKTNIDEVIARKGTTW